MTGEWTQPPSERRPHLTPIVTEGVTGSREGWGGGGARMWRGPFQRQSPMAYHERLEDLEKVAEVWVL